MEEAKEKVLFQPSTGRVSRATTREENHQSRSASAPRLGDLPERDPCELAQNQPGQVDTLSEENNLDQYTEMEGAAGGENLHLGPPKGRSSQLPQFQRHEEDNLEAAERREQRLMELLRQSNEMQRGKYERPDRSSESTNSRIAVSHIQETRTEGTALVAPNCSESN